MNFIRDENGMPPRYEDFPKNPMPADKSTEYQLLRKLINNLSRVGAFGVSFPAAKSAWIDGDDTPVECYDLVSLDMAMDTIIYGLRSPAFQHLVDLRLTVPGTYDVGRLAASLSNDVKQQLKHLFLKIVDSSGPGGNIDYTEEQLFDGYYGYALEDGTLTTFQDSNFAPSNLQIRHPNREHQDEVWRFIESCGNLESLALLCTHFLSLDRLKWKPGPRSKGLRALYLDRVYVNSSTITDLLAARASDAKHPAIRRLHLGSVKIYADGGNWKPVFDWLVDFCPEFEFFYVHNLTYFSTHPRFSNDFHPDNTFSGISTEEYEDNESLVAILEKLEAKAASRSADP